MRPHQLLPLIFAVACNRGDTGESTSSGTTTSGSEETTSSPSTTTTSGAAPPSTMTTSDATSGSSTTGGQTTGEESTAASSTTGTTTASGSTTTTTSGGEDTTSTSTSTTASPFEECIDALGPTYLCGECACEHCTDEIDACEADMGCHEIWKCVRETGCGPSNLDCLGPCGDLYTQYGGLFAPSAMLVSAVSMCVDNQCQGQC